MSSSDSATEAKKSNKIREIVKLQQILKKWRKAAHASKQASNKIDDEENNNKLNRTGSGSASKGIKFLKRTLSFTDVTAVPKGYLAVSAKFTLEHAWLELRHDPKWCGASTTKDKVQSKRGKLDEHSAQSSTSVAGEDDQSKRPIGVKAANAKGKRAVSNATKLDEEEKELQSIWSIRQKDFALKDTLNKQKDTLNKQKLLDSLIAKTEPLTELELALNKLIKDMLSL
ncbi:hypothetical protein F2Q69_00033089 [Brassica cretica]|uniref:No apical meristem-associated C-terminal domain-containing protein n=1 Tax=Brassica cretica TaxID=69181 RepID=A0A8S9SML4_BRACR|nr:hypothetical protein F2Q69_00033089 [Brassica cretica]